MSNVLRRLKALSLGSCSLDVEMLHEHEEVTALLVDMEA